MDENEIPMAAPIPEPAPNFDQGAPIPVPPPPGAPDQFQLDQGSGQFDQGPGMPPPPPQYQMPPEQQFTQTQYSPKARTNGFGSARKEKWPAVLLAYLFGWIGLHKFYLGYKTEGTIMLVVGAAGSILTFGFAPLVMAVISWIEAIKYLTLTEEDFDMIYVRGYKGWF